MSLGRLHCLTFRLRAAEKAQATWAEKSDQIAAQAAARHSGIWTWPRTGLKEVVRRSKMEEIDLDLDLGANCCILLLDDDFLIVFAPISKCQYMISHPLVVS